MKKKIKDALFEVDFFIFFGVNLKALLRTKTRRYLRSAVAGVARYKGKKRISIVFDMLIKCLCSTGAFHDYYKLRFYDMPVSQARTYLTEARFAKVQRRLRSPAVNKLLNDKALLLATFSKYAKRDYFIITEDSLHEELGEFIRRHREFIAKPNSLNAGRGIERVDSRNYSDAESLLFYLRGKGLALLEEPVKNHRELAKYSDASLNTVRMMAVRADEGVKIVFACLRFNTNGGITDNVSSGGCACPVDTATGRLYKGMTNFGELNGVYAEAHPNGFRFEGEQIPFWPEAVALVTEMMFALQEAFFVAWDIAITDEGPVMIEGNNSTVYSGLGEGLPYEAFHKAYRYAKKCQEKKKYADVGHIM